jgi:hypothetical protein
MRKILLTVLVALLSVLVLRLARRSSQGTSLLLALLALNAATPVITRNTPKTSATSARVDKVVASLGTLSQGIFTNVSGNTVTMVSPSGSVTCKMDALAQFGSANQTAFLAGLSKLGGVTYGTSGFGGGVWTSAQQTALSTLQSDMNSIITGLVNGGFT